MTAYKQPDLAKTETLNGVYRLTEPSCFLELSAGLLLRPGGEASVRHHHHGADPLQHDHHDGGDGRAAASDGEDPEQHQPGLHHLLHCRVPDQDHGAALLLLHRWLEHLRLRGGHSLHRG